MAKKRRASLDEQLALLDVPGWRKRRVEVAFDKAVAAARKTGDLEAADAGAITLGRALARAVDKAEAAGDPWALAAVSRELRGVLERLRLDPAARGVAPSDDLADLLAQMAD